MRIYDLLTLVVRDTIDLNSLVEFEQLKCVISVNIVDFVSFSMDLGPN